MKRAFGDSHYFLALLSPRDQDHAQVKAYASQWRGEIITTRWILTEVADGLAAPPLRARAAAFLERCEGNPFLRVIPASEELFKRGFALYQQRPDKEWSLTDCISFVVMSDEKLTEALTRDHHFEQAGYRALFA